MFFCNKISNPSEVNKRNQKVNSKQSNHQKRSNDSTKSDNNICKNAIKLTFNLLKFCKNSYSALIYIVSKRYNIVLFLNQSALYCGKTYQ